MRKLEENLKVGIFRPFAKVAAMKIGLGEVIVIKRHFEGKISYCPVCMYRSGHVTIEHQVFGLNVLLQ